MAVDSPRHDPGASGSVSGHGHAQAEAKTPLVNDLISVIVTTYEREDALGAVLRSLARQGDRNFEVVVADDGSGPATAAMVAQWQPRLGVPLRHVWHEHDGFRAGQIRNQAMLACRGGYLVFLDGDCIARPDFIAAHRRLAEPGWFVSGNRALLARALTEAVLREDLEPEWWDYRRWLTLRLGGAVNRVTPMLRLPLGRLRKLRAKTWRGARSCNLGAWRCDLDRVGGFDAAYNGWGREDSDLVVRLVRSGVRRKDGEFATGVLHLWHPKASRARLAQNDGILGQAIAGNRVQAETGLVSLRPSGEEAPAKMAATRT
jgi:glycosyltransferase involved in cell wall biosynthesis